MDDFDTLHDQQPPHSLSAEQALIGAILRDPLAYERVGDKVIAADFYASGHRLHWQAITDMMDANQSCDIVTLAEKLARDGLLADAGGLDYLRVLAQASNTSANIAAYADLVRDMSIMRAMLSAAGEQVAAVYQPAGRKASDLLSEAQARLAELAERGVLGSGWVTAKQATHRAIVRLEELFASGGGMVGCSTGWADLDRMTRGLEAGSLVIVAARPSMGKTTAAVQLAQHVATTAPYPVAIFSLEMSADALAMRMLSSLQRIDHDRLRSAKLDDDELHRLTPASATLANLNLHIDDQAGLTIQDITARAKRLHRQHGGLSLVVIDYLGLIAMQGKVENQNLGIGKITAALKGLAKTLKVPVVLLSQLNRDLEKRPNKRPIMSDLRDSGSIEQDADLIVFIYRDEVYNENSRDQGIAELIIAKQRNGPIGTVRLAWLGKYCRFDNLAAEWERPAEPVSRHNQNYEY